MVFEQHILRSMIPTITGRLRTLQQGFRHLEMREDSLIQHSVQLKGYRWCLDTSARSERHVYSSQSYLLNYAIIIVSDAKKHWLYKLFSSPSLVHDITIRFVSKRKEKVTIPTTRTKRPPDSKADTSARSERHEYSSWIHLLNYAIIIASDLL